jgi:ribosomal protein L37AE/L43A
MNKDQNKCQNCGSELKRRTYGMGYDTDIWKCVKCGELHESNKSTWIDIDGTEQEVML